MLQILHVNNVDTNSPHWNPVDLLTVGGFGLWALIDLLRIPGMVERKNEDILCELMAQYRVIGHRLP